MGKDLLFAQGCERNFGGNPSKVRSHNCANNKSLHIKNKFIYLFTAKSLYIPNICCTFAVAKV